MASIFISYKSSDRQLAETVASYLEKRGHAVWFDRALTAGKEFRSEIDERLRSSDFVVVLWTKSARASTWVRAEAASAARRGRLVSINVDERAAPPEFVSSVLATFKVKSRGEPAARDLAKINAALRTAVSAAFGQAYAYKVGELNFGRTVDFSLTALNILLVWTGLFFLVLYTQGLRADLNGVSTPVPPVLIAGLSVFFTAVEAPLAGVGGILLDSFGRWALRLGVSPTKKRLFLRWLGEGLGSSMPFMIMLSVTHAPSYYMPGVHWTVALVVFVTFYPLVLAFLFGFLLAPKYLVLIFNLSARRAVLQ